MRIGLTAKLLLMLGVTSLVSVLAMALAARWSFQHGFLDYLGQQELTRIAPLREVLLPIYARTGSWEFFERDPGAWPRFVDDTLQPRRAHPPGAPPPGAHPGLPAEPWEESAPESHHGNAGAPHVARPPRHPPDPRHPPPPPPPELLGLRVHLLDGQGRQVAGVPPTVEEPFRLPIELDALIDGIRPCTKANLEQLQGRLLALVGLLDDLHDLALSDAGALDYRFSPLDLGETVQVAVSQMQGAFARKGIALHLECNEGLPMDGDRGRLRQVLDNLLGNSLRYTDSGGVTRVAARRAGAWIRMSVEDTAPSVEPEALERLFERFYRVEASRSRAKGGAGLGLAICRNIVEAHHGSIQARAADAGGLAVEIRLPASDG